MSTSIYFYKMSGSGNDFILVDNRTNIVEPGLAPQLARSLCERKVSVGADGLILIENDLEVDFSWRFHNADGSSAEMCGNGGRCAARLANILGICGSDLSFRTLAGIIQAEVLGSRVKLQMTSPEDLRLEERLELNGRRVVAHFVNTGVPHTVFIMDNLGKLEEQDVVSRGRDVRYHQHYAPAGTNVNFVAVVGQQALAVRTYERGVEDETLACGTGATAVALVAAAKRLVEPPVDVRTRSGEILTIHFDPGERLPNAVYLEGETKVVYQGQLSEEAFDISINRPE
jgi:diaminopimelate epimerase